MNMVLAERNPEIMRNGRRSRGPSPNGHGGSPDSSSDEDNSVKKNGSKKSKQSEYEEKIRVGRDYQATCPELVPLNERKPELLNDRALLVWSPTKDIPDNKLEEYISVAKEKYGYNGEQALGMLFWHKHDLERAVLDLANFTPFPDEWTMEDKVLFEQAFQFHGKSFHRIRQMLPDKTIASLVKYYYSWKKTRNRQSVMDRNEKIKLKDGSDNGSENGSNEDSDEEKDQLLVPSTSQDSLKQLGHGNEASTSNKSSKNNSNQVQTISNNTTSKRQQQQTQQQSNTGVAANQTMSSSSSTSSLSSANNASFAGTISAGLPATSSTSSMNTNNPTVTLTSSVSVSNLSGNCNGSCTGCGVSCNQVNNTPHGNLCNSCYHHWRRTGTKRPTTGPYFGKRFRDRNAERHKRKPPRGMHINHDEIVSLASSNNQDDFIGNTEREIVSLLSQVQQNKQQMSALKRKFSDSTEDIHIPESNNRINARWTNEEILLAVEGIKKFGRDYQAIAKLIGNKTESNIRTFFINYRRRYNLDAALKEFETKKEANRQQIEVSSDIIHQQQEPQINNNQDNDIEVIDISSTELPLPQPQILQQSLQSQQCNSSSQIQQKPSSHHENVIMQIDLENEISLENSSPKNLNISISNESLKTST